MKALLVVTVFVALATVVAAPAEAETPSIGVFFDSGFSRMQQDCPGAGVMDTLYIVALNFNTYLMAVEYSINYPPAMFWVADLDLPALYIGSSPTGITEGFPPPQNGYNALLVAKAMFMWTCAGCLITDMPVIVSPHPGTAFLGAVDFPNYDLVPAVGMTSLVCATVPIEDTTWGQIKSLYGE